MKKLLLVSLSLILISAFFAGSASSVTAKEPKILEFDTMVGVPAGLTGAASQPVLRGIRGVVVGQLHRCDPAPDAIGPTAAEVVHERLGTLGVPVATGFEFGHDELHNAALPFGGMVRLRADSCTLDFLEPIAR